MPSSLYTPLVLWEAGAEASVVECSARKGASSGGVRHCLEFMERAGGEKT